MVTQDFSLSIVDIVAQTVVRKFESAHLHTITDCCFSPDSRWVLTASLDATVKVWDLPTGTLVDNFRFAKPVTSLSMSPKADFLATAHVDDLGIYLWTNLGLYSHLSLKPLAANEDSVTAAREIQMPLTSKRPTDNWRDELEDDAMEVEDEAGAAGEEDEFQSPEQLSEALITLANLPTSRWKNLLSLDIIKSRNKPKNEVVKPVSAPFFLPTVKGLETKFDLNAEKTEEEMTSKVMISQMTNLTVYGKELLAAESEKDFLARLIGLMSKGPSAIELEVTSLGPEAGGSIELLVQFLQMLLTSLRSKVNFEVTQAYLGLFLKVHGETVVSEPEVARALEEVAEEQERNLECLTKELNASATLVGFLKNAVIC